MGGNVFANGLEVSGKAVDAKTIGAMPDVCFTPPENPATPPGVPIPYPSFGMASDTESGTATVLISGKTVNIKNKSDESKTSGTEAGCAAKKGVITSKNTGKKYFNSWSTDVKFEGEPVIRFSDLATHNHASPIGNTPPWVEWCKLSPPKNNDNTDCIVGEYGKHQKDCAKNKTPTGEPYQFHHIIPDRCFRCDRIPPVPPRVTPTNVRMTAKGAPSHSSGMCICLPPQHHCPSSSSPPGTYSVHGYLDNRLTAVGQSGSPKGLASLQAVRGESIAALGKAVKAGVISKECYRLAVGKVMESTKDMSPNTPIRAEKSLANLDSAARATMKAVK